MPASAARATTAADARIRSLAEGAMVTAAPPRAISVTASGVSAVPSSDTLPSIGATILIAIAPPAAHPQERGRPLECRAMSTPGFTDGEREPVILDGSSLTAHGVAAIARDGAAAVLSPEARTNNDRARDAIAGLLARGDDLYGVTTGVGALRAYRVPEEDREAYGLNLLRSHACGAGLILTVPVVRAAMATRANQIGAGGAGVANELLDALVGALNAGLTPFTRELGSLGTGDLTNLADVALALLGEGRGVARR